MKEAGAARSYLASKVYQDDVKFEEVVEQLQDFAIRMCDAEVEEVDAKTGSFSGFDDMKPKVIRVDFGKLPEGGKERSKALMENGMAPPPSFTWSPRLMNIFWTQIRSSTRSYPFSRPTNTHSFIPPHPSPSLSHPSPPPSNTS